MLSISALLKNKKKLISFKDGTIHLALTRECNSHCSFCCNKKEPEINQTIEPLWLYEHFKPLYKQAKFMILTGGECTSIPEGLNFCKFIYSTYPNLSILLQTNGIAFTKDWQKMAAENLMYVKFSLNASTPKRYTKNVWKGSAGEKAYLSTRKNLLSYLQILKHKKRLMFAPGLSMVVNKNTAQDIESFITLALKIKAGACFFYFDIKENNVHTSNFSSTETSLPALIELLKISRLLRKKFTIDFELFLPFPEYPRLRKIINKIPLHTLRKEYAALYALAKNRSITKEHKARRQLRKKLQKKALSLAEELKPTLRKYCYKGKKLCFAPWKELYILPNGRIGICSWRYAPIKLQDHLQADGIAWQDILASKEFRHVRQNVFRKIYTGCMSCCPNKDSR